MRPAHVVTAIVVGLTLLGCGGMASPEPAPTVSAPTATATLGPTPAAGTSAPSVAPSIARPSPTAAVEARVRDGELVPGSYRSTTTGATIDFEIDEAGWRGAEDLPQVGFALLRPDIEGGLSVTHFPGEVFSQPCSPEEQEQIERSAEGFIGWLANHPELEATEPMETEVGGHVALQLDVSAGVGETCPQTPRIWLWSLPAVGDFHLEEGEAARFIATDVGDTTVVIVIETFDPADQRALLDASEPIVASMRIRD